jgi:UDP-GlcNAc:undecaprenyl-phosphate/decaprenyl-phosphate GlcNAc-1-phosphate transferase
MNATAAAAFSGAAAFVLAVVLLPLILRICARWRLYDFPGPLKIHSVPIPRLGGIAIALAISAPSFFMSRASSVPTWAFFAALGLIGATGLADDLRGLSPAIRIAAQIAAALLLWRAGWRLPMFGSGTLGFAAICLFIIIFVNAFNFLDGSDGLAAGIAGVAALAYIFLPGGMETGFGSGIAWSLLGACAGFLLFNFPPARIFMGDSGSTVLGFSISFLALDFYRVNPGVGSHLFFPILVAALPLLDAILAVLRRTRNGGSPLSGDRHHYCDLLLARGWSARRVLLAGVGISAAFSVVGWFGLRCSLAQAGLLAAISTVALFVWIVRLGSLRASEEHPQAAEVRS